MAYIDVIIPVKNSVRYLSRSLDSIRRQTFEDWRALVIDHDSTDGSQEVVDSFAAQDKRFELHRVSSGVTFSELLNGGLNLCDCQYVMRHDADDEAYERRMEISLAGFERFAGVTVVGGMGTEIDTSGRTKGEFRNSLGRSRLTTTSLFCNPITHPTAMFDFRELARQGVRYGEDVIGVLPQNEQISVPSLAEDYFLFGQLSLVGKAANIPDKLIKYRWHESNVSVINFEKQMSVSMAISRNLAKTFSALHSVENFDPAPFCNHGGLIFSMEKGMDLTRDFARMAAILRSALGANNAALERELAYRRVLATRNSIEILRRYAGFRAKHVPDSCEWYAVKYWVTRMFPGRVRVAPPAELFELQASQDNQALATTARSSF